MQRWGTDFSRAPLLRSQAVEMELLSRDRDVRRVAWDRVQGAISLGAEPATIYRSARAILSNSVPNGRKFLLAKAIMRLLEDMEDSGELGFLDRERQRRAAFLGRQRYEQRQARRHEEECLAQRAALDRQLAREEKKTLRWLRREKESKEDYRPYVGCSRKYRLEQKRLKFIEKNKLNFMDQKEEADVLADDWEEKWRARV